jgi:hypothetical protein
VIKFLGLFSVFALIGCKFQKQNILPSRGESDTEAWGANIARAAHSYDEMRHDS